MSRRRVTIVTTCGLSIVIGASVFAYVLTSRSMPDMAIATPEATRRRVLEHVMGQLKAEHGFHVAPLFYLAEPIEDFAEIGDPIWEVRRTDLHAGGLIDGLFWVNARDGSVQQVFPRSLTSINRDLGS